jgi:pyroglutamyl-peptidase
MKKRPILITSFQVWRSHQPSNSSDDLVAALWRAHQLPAEVVWLRQVPVNFQLAPIRVITEIARLQPRLVVCCGMAENRPYLCIEQQATEQQATGCGKTLQTSLEVSALLNNTCLTKISYDAGNYVCNALYYSVLHFIQQNHWPMACLFIHVPLLQRPHRSRFPRGQQHKLIQADFVHIIKQLAKAVD